MDNARVVSVASIQLGIKHCQKVKNIYFGASVLMNTFLGI